MSDAGLCLHELKIGQGGRVLAALDLCVAPGEVVTLMGPSGSGKSTILSVIIGTVDPAFDVTGSVFLNGTDLTGRPPQNRHIGILFQDDYLFPHLSVGANLAFGLEAGIRGRAQRRKRVEEALAEVGLDGFADRDPATLSGGQRARIALMRVLLAAPKALLLDEPFSKLDAERRDQIRQLVFSHARERRLPVILVTHDPADAAAAGGRVVYLGDA